MNENKVTKIDDGESLKQMGVVNFRCFVQLFDSLTHRNFPPEYFKLETQITLEFLEKAEEAAIGAFMKESLYILKKSIQDYKEAKLRK